MGKSKNRDGVIKVVLKHKFNILLADMKTTFLIKGLAPKLLFNIIDADLRRARKKINGNK